LLYRAITDNEELGAKCFAGASRQNATEDIYCIRAKFPLAMTASTKVYVCAYDTKE